ncbi:MULTISPECIES: hypothetical protein [unclassified Bradyrhizobium]|uniref:hypothetical protein n=1 Tax=unclassified Bradyrhizobium TaxID=2631580 RepID=UPI0028EADBEB|nr:MULTISPECIES: hypothetical protein [unclassified Bradyrhizobium]
MISEKTKEKFVELTCLREALAFLGAKRSFEQSSIACRRMRVTPRAEDPSRGVMIVVTGTCTFARATDPSAERQSALLSQHRWFDLCQTEESREL